MVGPARGSQPDASQPFRIASRGSALARRQAEHVAALLRATHHGLDVEIVIVRTTGDRVTDVPLARIGERGLFTKEVDDAVLRGDADAAVHSLKDLPTRLQEGLVLGAVPERADPRDAVVFAQAGASGLDDLPRGAAVGTSSLRRRAQLLALRPDLVVPDIRGNVDTRIAALDAGRYDAVILAAAGLLRLGLEARIGAYLDPPGWLPAPAQGAIGVTRDRRSHRAARLLEPITHAHTAEATSAERALLRRLEGGCQVPIGALATVRGGRLDLEGLVASLDGTRLVRGSARGAPGDAERLGADLAERLVAEGADVILRSVRAAAADSRPG